jgi:hypothetical protein
MIKKDISYVLDKVVIIIYTHSYMFNSLMVFAADVTYKPLNQTVASGDFTVPDLGTVLTFTIRSFFTVAGLAALLFLILGAFGWITSGGNKEAVDKARDKIMNAVIGMIILFAALAIVGLLENVLNIGMGITKPIEFKALTQPTNNQKDLPGYYSL